MSQASYLPTRGRWSAEERIVRGTEGDVWLAQGPDGPVILKIAHTEDNRTTLLREARVRALLDTNQLPALIETDEKGEWLVRGYTPGVDLSARQLPLSYERVSEIGLQLVDLLSVFHDAGVVHADIKPSNVVIGPDGTPHLIDLGAAFLVDEKQDKQFRGSFGYASPEQLQGKHPIPSSDIYSLGVLLYQLATDRMPFETANRAALAYLPLATLPTPPSVFCSNFPKGLERLLLSMLTREQSNRPEHHDIKERLKENISDYRANNITNVSLLGMPLARSSLRSVVSLAALGKGGVVVVYGRKGYGRSCLIEEAVSFGVREGMRLINFTDLPREMRAIRDMETEPGNEMATKSAKQLLCHGDASQPRAAAMATRILADKLPCLMFIRSEQPLEVLKRRGALHVAPDPLTVSEVKSLLESNGMPENRAERLFRQTAGRPGLVMEQIRPRGEHSSPLNQLETDLLARISDNEKGIMELAKELNLSDHQAVDLAERLLDAGLLSLKEDGHTVYKRQAETN
jgi:predicted Ser/Thr protein kinase